MNNDETQNMKTTTKWSPRTGLTIKVPSLEGVMAVSLSASSWTIMVFTDSVSPLLTFEELKEKRLFHCLKHITYVVQ